ncbi:glucosaminidase domain-containing protein [Pelagibacteraceae bacterium]|nr:glucosaminidase domain-containing protein [Pelagibacteraceae bacterium]
MKKRLTYRDQLLDLAKIYSVKEIQDYIKSKKSLTSGQLELILRKNKIIIPKDYKTTFFKENVSKPLLKISRQIDKYKDYTFKTINKTSRKIDYLKEDGKRSISSFFYNSWKFAGNVGLSFLNIFPKLGQTYYEFFSKFFINLFHGIYNKQIHKNKASSTVVVSLVVIGVVTFIVSSVIIFDNSDKQEKNQIVKKIEPKTSIKKQVKKIEPKTSIKKQVKKKQKDAELILPDLNLKTETVLNLFDDVNYDLNTVRFEKTVQPIYFTQFPKDLDEIQSIKLKKETFIKIVLPLVVAENEKIMDDKFKLKKIILKKITTDQEKQWLRQKFLEYKVKNGKVDELNKRMDIIPASIALAQAAKESGWGTSRFALEGNAIFGQWTWNGTGIEPLLKDKSKNHKILRFPILRASVKAYQNNLNTHKSYSKFREKRESLRVNKKQIKGLELAKTLGSYAQTGSEYTKILAKIITQNRLMDFELVRLVNSQKREELDL